MKKRKNQFPEIIIDGLKYQSVGSMSRLLIALAIGEVSYRLFDIPRSVGFIVSFLIFVGIRMAHYAHQIKKWNIPLRETLFYQYVWSRLTFIFFAILLMLFSFSDAPASNPTMFTAYLFGVLLFFTLIRLFKKRLFDENMVLLLRHYSDHSLLRAKRLSETVSNIATIHVVSEPEYDFMEKAEKLHNPVGIKFITAQDEWRDTVINKCRQAMAIIIDVEKDNPSPNVLWEIEQTGKLFPHKTALVAPLDVPLEWKMKIAPATELIRYDVDHQSENMKRDLLAFIVKSKRNYDRSVIHQD